MPSNCARRTRAALVKLWVCERMTGHQILVAGTSRDRQLPQQLAWSIGLVIALEMIGAFPRHIF